MPRGQVSQLVKPTISLPRVKLVYEKVTLTRFTALYFISSIVICILLSSLQIVSLAHDLGAVSALTSALKEFNIAGPAIFEDHRIGRCSGPPTDPSTICMRVATLDDEPHENITSRANDKASGADDNEGVGVGNGKSNGKGKGKGKGTSIDEVDNNVNLPLTNVPDTSASPLTSSLSTLIPPSTIPIPSTPVPTSSVPKTPSSPPTTSIATPRTSTAVPSASKTVKIPLTVNPPLPPPVTTSASAQPTVPSMPGPSPLPKGDQNSSGPEEACVTSIMWLNEVVHDSLREDVVTLIFQIWLFILAFVTVMNQSIAHLGAGLLGHMLGTAWRGYRVHFNKNLRDEYEQDVRACTHNNQEFLGGFERRIEDAIPLVALNSLALILLGYFSYKLLNDYADQTFRRVGASPKVQRLYKIVLVFSLCLQLSGFFSLASAALWLDELSRGSRAHLAEHGKSYLALSVVALILLFPWLVIGWIGSRRESRIGFAIFFVISLAMVGISTSMFSSNLYRYIFSNWSFFATITITTLIFLIGTIALGTVCRLNFGQGLAHYLQVSEALEEVDFTPAHFDTGHRGGDPEKPLRGDTETTQTVDFRLPVPVHSAQETQFRMNSVYSDNDRPPIQLSSSAPLESDVASMRRFSALSRKFKKFSWLTPSVGAKSMRREQDNRLSSGGAPVSIKSLSRLSRSRDPTSTPPLPSPHALSYVASNLSYVSSNAANAANPAAESQSSNPFL